MVEILIAIVLGFVAGALGALVTHDILLQKVEQERLEASTAAKDLQKDLAELKEHDRLADIAMQTMIIKFQKERGALWESVNGLWNDYDERHKNDAVGASKTAQNEPEGKEAQDNERN